jgi:glycosyltransferase involved in cell wall biosynthesis
MGPIHGLGHRPASAAIFRCLKIALVHDWLTGYRGGERVLQHFAQRFPDADLFTLFHTPGSVTPEIENRRIITSVLDRLPGTATHYRKLLPLFPWAIRRLDLRGYDLILSTSHAVAKSIRVPPDVPHLDYCFTPMRYVWDQADAYLGRGPLRLLATPAIRALRRFDVATSGPSSVTRFVAISTEVADRIRRHYGREANVVTPPVDLSWIEPASEPAEDFYLHVAGFVPYKRDSLVIETFRRMSRRLVVVGDGPGRIALEARATSNIEFVGRIDDAALANLYRRARALIHPQREDFGLVAVEAQAAGRPVIAFAEGGVRDTVRPILDERLEEGFRQADRSDSFSTGARPETVDPTGIFFHEPTTESLAIAIERFEKMEALFDPTRIRRWAERFSAERFDQAFDREIDAVIEQAR